MKIKVLVLVKGEDVSVYPNLTQLVSNNPTISYFSVYRALRRGPKALFNGYMIVSTQIRWKTHRRLPTAFE